MVARKNLQTHSFDFPKIPAAKKNGSYKSVTATRVIFSSREQHPPTPIAHTHGHAKGLGPNQAVWAASIFAALMQQNWSVSSTKQAMGTDLPRCTHKVILEIDISYSPARLGYPAEL